MAGGGQHGETGGGWVAARRCPRDEVVCRWIIPTSVSRPQNRPAGALNSRPPKYGRAHGHWPSGAKRGAEKARWGIRPQPRRLETFDLGRGVGLTDPELELPCSLAVKG